MQSWHFQRSLHRQAWAHGAASITLKKVKSSVCKLLNEGGHQSSINMTCSTAIINANMKFLKTLC